jgi:hypothetical protein
MSQIARPFYNTQDHILEDNNLFSYRSENLKPHIGIFFTEQPVAYLSPRHLTGETETFQTLITYKARQKRAPNKFEGKTVHYWVGRKSKNM